MTGEGRVRVLLRQFATRHSQKNPHPNPLPEYREREHERACLVLDNPLRSASPSERHRDNLATLLAIAALPCIRTSTCP